MKYTEKEYFETFSKKYSHDSYDKEKVKNFLIETNIEKEIENVEKENTPDLYAPISNKWYEVTNLPESLNFILNDLSKKYRSTKDEKKKEEIRKKVEKLGHFIDDDGMIHKSKVFYDKDGFVCSEKDAVRFVYYDAENLLNLYKKINKRINNAIKKKENKKYIKEQEKDVSLFILVDGWIEDEDIYFFKINQNKFTNIFILTPYFVLKFKNDKFIQKIDFDFNSFEHSIRNSVINEISGGEK